MKFEIFIFILVVASFQGLSNGLETDNVNLCARFFNSETFWPSYENTASFFKCNGGFRFRYECPGNLLFSFPCQVCVWSWDWVPPPPVTVISPNLPACVVDGTTSTSTSSQTTQSTSVSHLNLVKLKIFHMRLFNFI